MLSMITRHFARKIAASIDAELDATQIQIDQTRYDFPRNGSVQLEMDRRQAELDSERSDVQATMATLI